MNIFARRVSVVLTISSVFAVACQGEIGAAGVGPAPDDPDKDDPLAQSTVPLRPLTPYELSGAVSELLGDDGASFTPLQPAELKAAAETAAVGELGWRATRADQLETTMYTVAQRAVNEGPLKDCAAKAGDTGCVSAFYKDFLPKAFRRPVSDDELAVFVKVVSSLDGRTDRASAIARSLQAALLHPDFLYLSAQGDPTRKLGDAIELTPYELAARMAFTLWAAPPDAELRQAAEADALRTSEQVANQVRRMLKDPRAGRGVARMVLGWTSSGNSANHPKGDVRWSPQIAFESIEETQRFAANWMTSEGAKFVDLFDSDLSFVTPGLADFYGLPKQDGAGFRKVTGMKKVHRSGLLTQAAFLGTHAGSTASSPVHRGLWMVERVLCSHISLPQNDGQDKAPKRDPLMTTREYNEAILGADGCKGCHTQMAVPGFAFEGYDASGIFRTTDNNKPVRTDTVLSASGELNGSYADAIELSQKIGRSDVARSCFSSNWISYALGRQTSDADKQLIASTAKALETSAQDAVVAIVSSPAFRSASPNRP